MLSVIEKERDLRDDISHKAANQMGKAATDEERQIVGLLYQQMISDLQLLNTVDAQAKSVAISEHKDWSHWLGSPFFGIFLIGAACLLSMTNDFHVFGAVFALLAFAQQMVGIVFRKQKETVYQTKVAMFLKEEECKRVQEKRYAELEYASKEVHRLLISSGINMGKAEIQGIPELYCEIYGMEKMQDPAQAGYCRRLCESMLRHNDMEAVAYAPKTEDLYQIVPSDMVEMTIYPAIRKISDHKLIRKGMHYIKIV